MHSTIFITYIISLVSKIQSGVRNFLSLLNFVTGPAPLAYKVFFGSFSLIAFVLFIICVHHS